MSHAAAVRRRTYPYAAAAEKMKRRETACEYILAPLKPMQNSLVSNTFSMKYQKKLPVAHNYGINNRVSEVNNNFSPENNR